MQRNRLAALAFGILAWGAPAHSADKPDIAEETATFEIEASLPKLPASDHLLSDKLKADLMLRLEAFRREAAAEKRLAAEEKYEFRPYSLTVNWQKEADTPRLLSLIKYDWIYQGGAHGNTTHESLLFDRMSARVITFVHLFGGKEKEARDVMKAYVIGDLLRQKAKNAGQSAEGYQDEQVTQGVSGRFRVFTADRSTKAGKAAGLRIWYGPYEVGSYAEGTYEAFVPHYVFAAYLTEHYKPAFGGQSARAPE